MTQIPTTLQALCGVVLLVGSVGCGTAKVERPQTFPASGTVLLNGKPVEGAAVSFSTPKSPRIASGTTNAEGKFQLSSFGREDGAVPGSHQVLILKLDPALQQQPGEESDAYTTRMLGKDPGKSLLPAKYATPMHSPLKAEVTEAGPNEFLFDLR